LITSTEKVSASVMQGQPRYVKFPLLNSATKYTCVLFEWSTSLGWYLRTMTWCKTKLRRTH